MKEPKPGPTRAIRELHQSEIHTFLKCGKMWEFRYVLEIRVPPRAAATIGRSVDAAISHNFAQKIDSGTDLPASDVIDLCATEFDKESTETEFLPDEDRGQQKDAAIECVKIHHKEIAPRIQPATVQEKFILQTDSSLSLGGTIDLTTKNGWVRDSKTAKRKGMYSAQGTLQATLYDFAYELLRGKRAAGFGYDVMVKPTKTMGARTEVVETVVTDADRDFMFDTIHNVDKAMRVGVALPAPEASWWCSPDWCGYWHMCKGKK